ncbi:32566_t:CDS:1, partial [Racocetra persica]
AMGFNKDVISARSFYIWFSQKLIVMPMSEIAFGRISLLKMFTLFTSYLNSFRGKNSSNIINKACLYHQIPATRDKQE